MGKALFLLYISVLFLKFIMAGGIKHFLLTCRLVSEAADLSHRELNIYFTAVNIVNSCFVWQMQKLDGIKTAGQC